MRSNKLLQLPFCAPSNTVSGVEEEHTELQTDSNITSHHLISYYNHLFTLKKCDAIWSITQLAVGLQTGKDCAHGSL